MFGKLTALNSKTTTQGDEGLRDMRALSEAELDAVSGGVDYNLGFGIHLVNVGNYYQVYTDAKGPVVAT